MGSFYTPLVHEAVTVSTSAIGVTTRPGGAGYPKASAAVITVESQPVRYTVSGTDPTSTTGTQAPAGSVIELTSWDEVTKFRAIRDATSTGSATLRVQPYMHYA